MRIDGGDVAGIRWWAPDEAPLRLSGFAWYEQDRALRRLPKSSSGAVPEAVDALAEATTGGQVSLRTDARRLLVAARMAGPARMDHMPPTGQSGFDCYIGEPGALTHAGVARFEPDRTDYVATVLDLPEAEPDRVREVVVNFPLYQGVQEVAIGIPEDAQVAAPTPYVRPGQIILYGTSVTQGGCASRPGMVHSNILGRALQMPVVNLGFSGNGRGEPEVAKVIATAPDPALFILDYEGNSGGADALARTLPEFIAILRAAHPDVPILVLTRVRYAREGAFATITERRLACRAVAREVVTSLQAQGDEQLHLFECGDLIPEAVVDECSVDGAHLTDLGFWFMADGLLPVVRALVAGSDQSPTEIR